MPTMLPAAGSAAGGCSRGAELWLLVPRPTGVVRVPGVTRDARVRHAQNPTRWAVGCRWADLWRRFPAVAMYKSPRASRETTDLAGCASTEDEVALTPRSRLVDASAGLQTPVSSGRYDGGVGAEMAHGVDGGSSDVSDRADDCRAGSYAVIISPAELDLLTAPQVLSDVRRVLSTHPQRVIVDMSKVRFLAANGIGALLQACEEAQRDCVRLQLIGVHSNDLVCRILTIAKAIQLFDIADPAPVLGRRSTVTSTNDREALTPTG